MAAEQPRIGGTTRLIGIVGDPVAQVKSPHGWNPRLAALMHDTVMVPIHLRERDFDAAIDALMRVGNLDGLVVTMPFKERIIPHLGSVSRRAQQVGAVNAARPSDEGGWIGDMFDGVGLVGAVSALGLDPQGLRVGLLGAGGAGSAIAFALAESGVAALRVQDTGAGRAERLVERVAGSYPEVEASAGLLALGDLDLLVNATPVGMQDGDGTPIEVETLTEATTVVDIVTRPETPLLAAAARAGCRHAGGAAMVAAQMNAILAFLGLADKRP